MAIISLGTYPAVGITAAERAYSAASYGLLTSIASVSFVNVLTGSVLFLGSVINASVAGIFSIKAILWEGDETSGRDIASNDSLLIVDSNGMRITGKQAKGTGDGLELFLEYPIIVNGITVSIIDGGVLYIYV